MFRYLQTLNTDARLTLPRLSYLPGKGALSRKDEAGGCHLAQPSQAGDLGTPAASQLRQNKAVFCPCSSWLAPLVPGHFLDSWTSPATPGLQPGPKGQCLSALSATHPSGDSHEDGALVLKPDVQKSVVAGLAGEEVSALAPRTLDQKIEIYRY